VPPIDLDPVQRAVAEPEAAAQRRSTKPRIVKEKPSK
jgi:hypothetical protein